jgi:hypothetical protein
MQSKGGYEQNSEIPTDVTPTGQYVVRSPLIVKLQLPSHFTLFRDITNDVH